MLIVTILKTVNNCCTRHGKMVDGYGQPRGTRRIAETDGCGNSATLSVESTGIVWAMDV